MFAVDLDSVSIIDESVRARLFAPALRRELQGYRTGALFRTLAAGHQKVSLTPAEMRALKCWVDLNCPLWPDYQFRDKRPGPLANAQADAR